MRFAHIADCHIGGWREPKLQELGYEAFKSAIELCIQRKVNFILIAGDLFNSALPAIEGLKVAVTKLKQAKEAGIAVYIIAGSHDYSPSGKTMLDVLEQTGLFVNVAKGDRVGEMLKLRFTIDKKTGVKITGVLGKRAGLDRVIYEGLMREELEKEEGYKIFMFHNLLTEFKTKELEKAESSPISLLPKGFDYYAGGHVHIVEGRDVEGYGRVVYPGPTWPNNFTELEKLGKGGFFIVENGKAERVDIELKKVVSIFIDAEGKTAEQAEKSIMEEIEKNDARDAIVTLRVEGVLESGKPSDINFKGIFDKLNEKGAFIVLRNITKLATKEFEEIKVESGNVEEIEERLIKEHLGQIKAEGMEDEEETIKELMNVLSSERLDGEKVADYEKRIREEAKRIFLV